tara:strand:- start:55 stop:312 length:258 start_codon:yes stop_codon:yes gene_type:complete
MAIAQTASDKKSAGQISKEVGGISVFQLGAVDFATGTGAPATGASGDMKASPKGSIYVQTDAPDLYMKKSVAGASVDWEKVGLQS